MEGTGLDMGHSHSGPASDSKLLPNLELIIIIWNISNKGITRFKLLILQRIIWRSTERAKTEFSHPEGPDFPSVCHVSH